MDYFIPMLLGVVMKFLDDMVDLKLNIPILYIYLSQLFIIIFSILAIKDEVILGLVALVALIFVHYFETLDHDFWYIYLYIISIVCVYFKNEIVNVLLNKNSYYKIAFLILIPFVIYSEANDCKEEYSKYKTKYRIYTIIVNSLIICFLEYTQYTETFGLEFIIKILIFINAYCMTNIIIQYLFIEKLQSNNKIIQDTTKIEEEELQK